MVIFTFFSVCVVLAGIGHKRSRGSWQRVDVPQHTDPFFYSCAGAREVAQPPAARAPTRASLTVAPTVASTVASTVANRQQAPPRAERVSRAAAARGGGCGRGGGVAGGGAVAPIPVVVFFYV